MLHFLVVLQRVSFRSWCPSVLSLWSGFPGGKHPFFPFLAHPRLAVSLLMGCLLPLLDFSNFSYFYFRLTLIYVTPFLSLLVDFPPPLLWNRR